MMNKSMMIENLKNSKLMSGDVMNFDEYTTELEEFQKIIGALAFDYNEDDDVRLDDIVVRLKMLAREKGLEKDPCFKKGISSLRVASIELSICKSGKLGESRTAWMLGKATREKMEVFRNVYLSDEESETELDDLILTDKGLLILEVKNIKENVTITEDGRMLVGEDKCFQKKALGEKMSNKRRLLRKTLEIELKNRGVDLEIGLDSYIVFTSPKDVFIQVEDHYGKEKYCRLAKLKYIVDEHDSNVQYSDEEFALLSEIIGQIKTSQKKFSVKIDFNEVFEDFLNLLDVLGIQVENESSNKTQDKLSLKQKAATRILAKVAGLTLAVQTALEAVCEGGC